MKHYSISEDQLKRRCIARTGLRICTCQREELEEFVPVSVADTQELIEYPERFEKHNGKAFRKE